MLFFFHGVKLPRNEVAKAARNWQVQAAIFGMCFIALPLSGWLLVVAFGVVPSINLPSGLIAGIIFLCVLPTTVQSAVSYSSLAGGNVATSVVAAALLNLVAIILTPLLFAMLADSIGSANGNTLGSDIVIKIVLMLLLPFALGQIAQRWIGDWARRKKAALGLLDKFVISFAVYVSFSAAVEADIWMTVSGVDLLALSCGVIVLLVFAFGGSWLLGSILNLERSDRISLLFGGAQKSIATGAPMAAILFTGSEAGMVILPAIIYHQLQLIISAPIAARLASGKTS